MDIGLGHLSQPLVNDSKNVYEAGALTLHEDVQEELGDILEKFANPVIVCNSDSRTAAEPYLEEVFKDYPVIELSSSIVFSDNGIKKLMTQLEYCDRGLSSVSVDAIIAIGNLTITEMSKTAALLYDIPYIIIETK